MKDVVQVAIVCGCLVAGMAALSMEAQAQAPRLQQVVEQDGRGVRIAVELELPGQLSMAIYANDDRLLRTLLRARPLQAGTHVVAWDGLDREGNAMPPGTYTVKLLQSQGLASELVVNVGVNPQPWWEEGVGNHASTMALAADADGLTLFAGGAEGGLKSARIDPEGAYIWGGVGNHAAQFAHYRQGGMPRVLQRPYWSGGPVAAATVAESVYALDAGGKVFRVSRDTGHVLGKPWSVTADGTANDAINDIDARGELLVVADGDNDELRWYGLADGKLLRRAAVPAPIAVALGADAAYVISEGQILRVSEGSTEAFIAAEALHSPWRLSVDAGTGELLVAENSISAGGEQEHHQVKRFSAAGVLLQAYGAPAGRQDGAYVPTDFRGIRDIAADGRGGFVVTEPATPPRRVAHVDRNGEVLLEFFGAAPYGNACAPEPDDPTIVWYSTYWEQGLVRAQIDPRTHSWRVLETYREPFAKNPLVRAGVTHSVGWLRLFDHQGRRYLSHSGGALFLYDPEAKSLRATNSQGMQYLDYKGWVVPEAFRDTKPQHSVRTGYLWSDANDDGLATRDELALYNGWGDGALTGRVSHYRDDLARVYTSGTVLTPTSITDGGTPVYAPTQPQTLPIPGGTDIFQASDGSYYRAIRQPIRGEKHGIYWWPGLSGLDRLEKYTAAGERIYSIGRHSATWDREPGWSHGLEGIVGEVRDCIVVDGNFVDTELVGPMVWTTDGLFVDELCIKPGGTLPEWIYTGSKNENPRGTIAEWQGNVLFYAYGNNSLPVWHIDGWDTMQRSEGTIELKQQATAALAEGDGRMQLEYFNNTELAGEPVVSRPVQAQSLQIGKPTADEVNADAYSTRLTGSIEAPLAETYVLVLQTASVHGHPEDEVIVRAWLNEELVIDSTTDLGVEPRNYKREFWRAAMPMRPGERHSLRIDYIYRGGKEGPMLLCWESPSTERQSIPGKYLYAEQPETLPDARAVNQRELLRAGRRTVVESQPRQSHRVRFALDEGIGHVARAADAYLHGTLHGGFTWGDGVEGQALHFAGGHLALTPELRMPHTDYSIDFWFKSEATHGRLLSINRKPTFHNNFVDNVVALSDGKVRLTLGRESITTDTAYNDGEWHRVTVTVADGCTLQVDGERVSGATGQLPTWHLWHVPTERLTLRVGPGDRGTVIAIDELVIDASVTSER